MKIPVDVFFQSGQWDREAKPDTQEFRTSLGVWCESREILSNSGNHVGEILEAFEERSIGVVIPGENFGFLIRFPNFRQDLG